MKIETFIFDDLDFILNNVSIKVNDFIEDKKVIDIKIKENKNYIIILVLYED